MILSLLGNPLNKDIMAIYSEPNGTHKLLTFMLDNLQGMIFFHFIFDYFVHSLPYLNENIYLKCEIIGAKSHFCYNFSTLMKKKLMIINTIKKDDLYY